VDVVVTATDPATLAVKKASRTIPVVMLAVNFDPVKLGYIGSLARPGGNITGLVFQHHELTSKRFELFREMLPTVSRVAVFSDSETVDQLSALEAANRSVGVKLQTLQLRNPPYDFESAFRTISRSGAEALLVLEAASIYRGRSEITQLALKNRLPTSFAFPDYVEAGGLMSYGVNFGDMWRHAARYTDKVLKGAKPADLPVEQPRNFELAINLKTAKALKLTTPPSLLLRADSIIE